MNCQNFESLVTDLARQQIMEANLREQALAHSDTCDLCASLLRDERALAFGLGALVTAMKPASAPQQVEAEVLAAFRNRESLQRPRSSRWSYLAAAAAVLLIIFGIAAMRLWLQRPIQASFVADAAKPTGASVSPQALPISGEPGKASQPLVEKTAVKPHKRTVAVGGSVTGTQRKNNLLPAGSNSAASVQQSEVASAFMPLGYMSPTSLQDGGQIVRVELPRSAMVNLGFAVNMDRYSERVKADVLVGNDGLARAIRFVQ